MKLVQNKLVYIIIAFAILFILAASWVILINPTLRSHSILAAYEKSLPQNTTTCTILNPYNGTILPPEISPITFRWSDASVSAQSWLISIQFKGTKTRVNTIVNQQSWKPSKQIWETIKSKSSECQATVAVIGINKSNTKDILSGSQISFTTSKDSVGNPLFYREVILPFSEAVKDPSRIKWRFGTIAGDTQPPTVLENLPVCGNCHSFSMDGKTLGMDVDYANDKGAYAITTVERAMQLSPGDIISWSDYKRDEKDPTFGLLSQVSPDGKYVLSTVKDRSVFVPTPDLTFSQLFFPIQGILAFYSKATKSIQALPGANDPTLVQSNPSWSPDGRFIVFARSNVYRLKNLQNKNQILLTPDDCEEFLTGKARFSYDLYRIPFNNGKGGIAQPLTGASNNGMSNFFAKYSPNGKWIVYCRAKSFMLLQPDSKLHILPANGGEPRLMQCNLGRMNSWHTWSSNSHWLVFASKQNSAYTQLFITHIDTNGNDAPPVLLENLTAPDRAANIPEFVYNKPHAIEKISERFIDDVSLWRAGKTFEEAGDQENARLQYIKALEINPNNVKVNISLGNILEYQGSIDDALTHYLKAARLDSTYENAHINVGNIYFQKNDMARSVSSFLTALKIAPGNGFAHYNLAQAYLTLGKHSEALAHFKETMRLMPGDTLTLFGLGNTYVKIGRYDDAIQQFKKGVNLLPYDPDSHHFLAEALVSAGRVNDAIDAYRKALKMIPNSHGIRLYLANLLMKTKDYSAARVFYEEALKIKPGFKEAQDSLAVLERQRSQPPR